MNRKFLIINKLFLSMFVMAIFLWLGFVKWQYSSVSDPAQCSAIPDNSTDSNWWTSYTTNLSNPYPWYINDTQAIVLASKYDGTPNVCDWTFNYEARNIERITWKQSLCNTQINTLISHQKNLFDEFNAVKQNNEYEIWFNDYKDVWNLQSLMSNANCQWHTDCKLWVVTTSNFLFCKVCSEIWDGWTELDSLIPKKCPEWSIFAGNWDICCQPAPTECKKPTITIDDWITTYEWNTDLIVKIDYSNNDIWNLSYYFDKIKVDWATDKKDYSTWNKIIQFTITPIEWINKISIDVEEGCAILEVDKNCPQVEIEIDRKIDCQLTKDWKQCNPIIWINTQPVDVFTWFASLLAEGVLCKKWTLEIQFCPDMCLNWQINNQTCEQTYGSWWYANNKTPKCCIDCGWDKIYDPEEDECVCDPNKECSKKWYVVDPATCKCECDPSKRCCGIELNTVVPFIWDCIEMTTNNSTHDLSDPNKSNVNQLNAFPFLMMGLSKIMVTVILIFSFLVIIAAGLMMVTGVYDQSNYSKWVDRIKKILWALILLWTSGLILKLINPSFFGG